MLADGQHYRAIRRREQTPVTRWISGIKSKDSHAGACRYGSGHGFQRLLPHQRVSPEQHQHCAGEALKRRQCLADRIAGAAGRRLNGDAGGRLMRLHLRLDGLCTVADNGNDAARTHCTGCAYHVADERTSACLVQHLGQLRAHARSHARRQHDARNFSHRHVASITKFPPVWRDSGAITSAEA